MGNERKMVDSGVEWIEDVPEGWALVRCGELFSQRTEKGKNTERMLTCSIQSGVMPQEKYEELTGRKLSKPVNNKENYNKTYKGDLVYNKMRMWQGAVGLSDYNGVVSPAYVVLVCSAKQNSRYSYWQFVSECFIEQSNSNSKGICDDQNSLSFNRFSQMTMLLPPLPEQQAIATFLDHHVDLIDRERELIAQKIGLLQDKRKALIFECVTGKRTIVEAQHLAGVDDWSDIVGSGSLVAVPTPGKDDPFVKGGRLVDSGVEWIGEVPEGWRITRITDEYIVSAGIGAPQDAEPFQEGLLPFVRVSDLAKNPGRLVKETRDGVSVSYSQYKQKAGTLVFPKSGESIRTGARKLLHMDSVVVGHLACVTSRTSGTNMDYGYYLFNAFDFEDELNQTALPALNLSAIQSKRIPFPSAHEQTGIATFLDHETNLIDSEIDLLETKSSLLADKRKALIFEAVTGKIDCTQP